LAVTRSWEAKLTTDVLASAAGHRVGSREFAWLLSASAMVAAGLFLVYSAKTQNIAELAQRLDRGDVLNLNRIASSEDLLPLLQIYQDVAPS
jgi:hypothetical protein